VLDWGRGAGSQGITAGLLYRTLLALGAFLGNSDVDIDPIEEPIEDILDGQDEGDDPAQVARQVRPVAIAPGNTAALVVRVSGLQGTAYSGTYGTSQGGMTPVEGVLEAEPAEYGIEARGGVFGVVSAVFRKSQPVPGILRAEVLSSSSGRDGREGFSL